MASASQTAQKVKAKVNTWHWAYFQFSVIKTRISILEAFLAPHLMRVAEATNLPTLSASQIMN